MSLRHRLLKIRKPKHAKRAADQFVGRVSGVPRIAILMGPFTSAFQWATGENVHAAGFSGSQHTSVRPQATIGFQPSCVA